ncbi:hypothetical protein JOL79_00895 [Microbispora sp. RL4-1S]|uniref:Septum formation initiator n=1 Tax=Microbispora oryzae TaxID=2806554 RepID=A0A940WFP8_9ACTN|nr:hypothetical protein [Microbispora oryzae]MBP2702352.1 hypothetical protein [Microbispora oryzae]
MAATAARVAAARRPLRSFHRPARAPFVLVVVGLMCGGLVTLLLLNTVLAKDSFKLSDLRSSIDELHQQAAAQENQLRVWNQPGALDEAARQYQLRADTSAPEFVTTGPTGGESGQGGEGGEGTVR